MVLYIITQIKMDGLDIGVLLKDLQSSGEDSPFKDFKLDDAQLKALNAAATAKQKELLEAELEKTEAQRKKEASDKAAEDGRKKKAEEEEAAKQAAIKKMKDDADFGALLSTKDKEIADIVAKNEELANLAKSANEELEGYRKAAEAENQATLEELKKNVDEAQFKAIEAAINGADVATAKTLLASYKGLVKPKGEFNKNIPGKQAPAGEGSIADLINKHRAEK